MAQKLHYLVAEGGKPKELLEKWREDYLAANRRVVAFCREIGAVDRFAFHLEKPSSFGFPRGQVPDGWTKPDSHGRTRPKKANLEMIARIAALDWPELPEELMRREFNLPTGLRYGEDGNLGGEWFCISAMRAATLSWLAEADGRPGPVILIVRDYDDAMRAHQGKPVSWAPTGASNVIPDGFRVLTEAEFDLACAQNRVDREAYSKVSDSIGAELVGKSGDELRQALGRALADMGKTLDIQYNDNAPDADDRMIVSYAEDGMRAHASIRAALAEVLSDIERRVGSPDPIGIWDAAVDPSALATTVAPQPDMV